MSTETNNFIHRMQSVDSDLEFLFYDSKVSKEIKLHEFDKLKRRIEDYISELESLKNIEDYIKDRG